MVANIYLLRKILALQKFPLLPKDISLQIITAHLVNLYFRDLCLCM